MYSALNHVSLSMSKMEGDLLRPSTSKHSSNSLSVKNSRSLRGLQPRRAMKLMMASRR